MKTGFKQLTHKKSLQVPQKIIWYLILKFVIFFGIFWLISSCGSKILWPPDGSWGKEASNPNEFVTLNIGLNSGKNLLLKQKLFLSDNATSFLMDITNCSSGFSKLNFSTTSVALYKGDKNCRLELKSFVWNNKTWTKKPAGGNFYGSTPAIFMNASDNMELGVRVLDEIASPITTAGTARFVFDMISEGASKQILNFESSGHKLNTVDTLWDAPHFLLNDITLNTITNTTNEATFSVTLECSTDLVGNDCISTPNSQAHLLTNFTLSLVKDVYSNTLTWNQAQTATDNATTNKTQVLVGDIVATTPTFHGGFTLSLTTLEDLSTTTNLILIQEYTKATSSERSYIYYNIDFSVLPLMDLTNWLQGPTQFLHPQSFPEKPRESVKLVPINAP